jgi:hypothetical protein
MIGKEETNRFRGWNAKTQEKYHRKCRQSKLENKMLNMIFKQDIADFNKQKMEYESNMI